MMRTRLPVSVPSSGTMIAPSLGRTASILGTLKDAPAPSPSTLSALPLPASVLTAPPSVTARMRWFRLSLTRRTLRSADHAMPRGPLNRAVIPTPSFAPLTMVAFLKPASVVTAAESTSIARMRLENVSAT
jgi:hypothetical protein